MRPLLVSLILLLFLLSGCNTDLDPGNPLPDPVLELTDGYCLVENGRIWLGELQLSSEVEVDYWH